VPGDSPRNFASSRSTPAKSGVGSTPARARVDQERLEAGGEALRLTDHVLLVDLGHGPEILADGEEGFCWLESPLTRRAAAQVEGSLALRAAM
jgi:hypothetical protein